MGSTEIPSGFFHLSAFQTLKYGIRLKIEAERDGWILG